MLRGRVGRSDDSSLTMQVVQNALWLRGNRASILVIRYLEVHYE